MIVVGYLALVQAMGANMSHIGKHFNQLKRLESLPDVVYNKISSVRLIVSIAILLMMAVYSVLTAGKRPRRAGAFWRFWSNQYVRYLRRK